MSDTAAGVAFYVRVPDSEVNPAWRVKHADETVNVMSGFFTAPFGTILQEPDGTYRVIAPAPSSVSIIRRMLVDHEGLIIEREEPLTGTVIDLMHRVQEQQK